MVSRYRRYAPGERAMCNIARLAGILLTFALLVLGSEAAPRPSGKLKYPIFDVLRDLENSSRLLFRSQGTPGSNPQRRTMAIDRWIEASYLIEAGRDSRQVGGLLCHGTLCPRAFSTKAQSQ